MLALRVRKHGYSVIPTLWVSKGSPRGVGGCRYKVVRQELESQLSNTLGSNPGSAAWCLEA